MDKKQFEIISKKLDRIIALLIIQKIESKDEIIYSLKKFGLDSGEIGLLVGIKNVRKKEGWKRK